MFMVWKMVCKMHINFLFCSLEPAKTEYNIRRAIKKFIGYFSEDYSYLFFVAYAFVESS